MIREWEKFHADFKKLDAAANRYTDKTASGYLKQVTQSKTLCDKHEYDLTQAVEAARDGGVIGKTLADFMKSKDFAAAKKKMDAAVADLDDDIKSLSTFCIEAQKVSNQIVDLHKALEKDLKARKLVSDGRKETEALLEAIDAQYQRLMIVVAHKNRLARPTLLYSGFYPKVLAKIIADAPKVGSKGNSDLPEIFDLSYMKDKVTRCLTGSNKVIRACGAAVDTVPADMNTAKFELKQAMDELAKLKVVDRDYREALDANRKAIQAAPECTKIEKLLLSIAKSLQGAERAVLAASTTVKRG